MLEGVILAEKKMPESREDQLRDLAEELLRLATPDSNEHILISQMSYQDMTNIRVEFRVICIRNLLN